MKKVIYIISLAILFLFAYNLFLIISPSKIPPFENQARVESFVFTREYYPIVLTGSSLSGLFGEPKAKDIFGKSYFNMYLPYWGACTGVEVLRLSKKVPKILFVEVNQIHRGIDTNMVRTIFDSPIYNYRNVLPFTLSKNKFLPYVIDRFKKPQPNKASKKRLAAALFDSLLTRTQESFEQIKDKKYLDSQINRLSETVKELSSKGCQIYFYELPMDIHLRYSKVMVYERTYFEAFAKKNNFHFIPADTSRAYQTSDGEHLLEGDRIIYLDYLKKQLPDFNKSNAYKTGLVQ
jgi:hypothetical protein